MEAIKDKNEILSWAAFLGCMFIGMGIGELFDQAGVGMLIGMGVGYIASALVENTKRNNSQSNTTS